MSKSILHIGLHKTGSTTLQQALYGAGDELTRQRFFYPRDYLPHKSQHSDLAMYLRGSDHEDYRDAIGRILADFAAREDAQLLLSGEEFSMLPRAKLEILRASLAQTKRPFHIVLYLRNLYRFALSVIAQHSKQGKFLAYPSQVMGHIKNLDLTALIARWESVFGEEQVHVFSLETLPPGRNIVGHFADFAGFSLPGALPGSAVNRSVDPIASALLTHLAYEFGVPYQLFYKSYFQATNERFPLPRTETYLNTMLDKWVAQVDVSHPKLAPHREALVQQPSVAKDEGLAGAAYLKALAATLTKTARRMDARRKKAELDEIAAGNLDSTVDTATDTSVRA